MFLGEPVLLTAMLPAGVRESCEIGADASHDGNRWSVRNACKSAGARHSRDIQSKTHNILGLRSAPKRIELASLAARPNALGAAHSHSKLRQELPPEAPPGPRFEGCHTGRYALGLDTSSGSRAEPAGSRGYPFKVPQTTAFTYSNQAAAEALTAMREALNQRVATTVAGMKLIDVSAITTAAKTLEEFRPIVAPQIAEALAASSALLRRPLPPSMPGSIGATVRLPEDTRRPEVRRAFLLRVVDALQVMNFSESVRESIRTLATSSLPPDFSARLAAAAACDGRTRERRRD